jgi:uncharacterized damage-inducible protein DinB
MKKDLIIIFGRDLDKLHSEIEAFHREENLWKTSGSITNTAGNLCLHLIGNLKTYIGNNLGSYPYTRDREAEFSLKDIPRQELLEEVENTKRIVLSTLEDWDQQRLDDEYVENFRGNTVSNRFFLLHLTTHLSYHLGQVNYLRRMLE